ncbi:response regulator transcription factor [Sneathiella limimaris]|uniref:response regulator transcription factor n=1 Tax=Sneathiella limimaris TaxID=1964213 RepID=UPI0019CFE6F6|nr:response regulator transcription factor [Sneathiella limimaris]
MRTLIIDDYEICRSGIRSILEETFDNCIVCEADKVEGAMNCLRGHGADLVILAINESRDKDRDIIPTFFREAGEVPIIAFGKTNDRFLRECLKSQQFKGVINRSDRRDIVTAAIRLVLAGGQYFPPDMHTQATVEMETSVSSELDEYGNLSRLTKRQRQVLRAISQGKSNKLIAEELGISPGTVKVHVSNLMKDLNAKNRTQAVAIANNLEIL